MCGYKFGNRSRLNADYITSLCNVLQILLFCRFLLIVLQLTNKPMSWLWAGPGKDCATKIPVKWAKDFVALALYPSILHQIVSHAQITLNSLEYIQVLNLHRRTTQIKRFYFYHAKFVTRYVFVCRGECITNGMFIWYTRKLLALQRLTQHNNATTEGQ